MTAYVRPFFDWIPIELVSQVITSVFISPNSSQLQIMLRAAADQTILIDWETFAEFFHASANAALQ